MKSNLDRSFHYTTADETDLRKTFARIRREAKKRDLAKAASQAETKAKVTALPHISPRQAGGKK
jgi:hypothetical protein